MNAYLLRRKCICDRSNKDTSHSPLIPAQRLLGFFLPCCLISGDRNQISLSLTDKKWQRKHELVSAHQLLSSSLSFSIYRSLFLGRKTAWCVSVDVILCYSTAVDTSVSCYFPVFLSLSTFLLSLPALLALFLCFSSLVHWRRFCHTVSVSLSCVYGCTGCIYYLLLFLW